MPHSEPPYSVRIIVGLGNVMEIPFETYAAASHEYDVLGAALRDSVTSGSLAGEAEVALFGPEGFLARTSAARVRDFLAGRIDFGVRGYARLQ
jgi:hypothetical protein